MISGNESSEGGGVYIRSGTFTMKGGTISGNNSNAGNSSEVFGGYRFYMAGVGGGVRIAEGTFTKTGGIIAGNDDELSANTASGLGKAIYQDGSHYRNSTAGETATTDKRSFWLND